MNSSEILESIESEFEKRDAVIAQVKKWKAVITSFRTEEFESADLDLLDSIEKFEKNDI